MSITSHEIRLRSHFLLVVLTSTLMGTTHVLAIVWHVPDSVSTIQAALDSIDDGDTILVESGLYVESLAAPSVVFWMIGSGDSDSTNGLRPIINPTAIAGSDSLSCIRFDGQANARIENIAFANDTAMADREDGYDYPGGIRIAAGSLSLRNCIFDSVFYGVVGASGIVTIDSCVFVDCWRAVLCGSVELTMRWCDISDVHGGPSGMVRCESGSHFYRCNFYSRSTCTQLSIYGDRVLVDSCQFIGNNQLAFHALQISTLSGTAIRNCVFRNHRYISRLTYSGLLCDQIDQSAVRFEGCQFEDNSPVGGSNAMIEVVCVFPSSSSAILGTIEGNTFLNNFGGTEPDATTLFTDGRMLLMGNRFVNCSPPNYPDIYYANPNQDTMFARNNYFEQSGLAISSLNRHVDARWNWWGDASGPYNEHYNPNGNGGEVNDNVIFDPWWTDTSFVSVPERRNETGVASFALHAFPNPFNSEIELRLTASRHGEYVVELFDLLGRKVDDIWAGFVEDDQTIRYRAAHLSSGIYFVRAKDSLHPSISVMEKVILLR